MAMGTVLGEHTEGEVRSKPRDTDTEESYRGAHEKVRGNRQGVKGKQ